MPIALVDTHTHVVSPDRGSYPLDRARHPGGDWVDAAPVSAPELAAEASTTSVRGLVLVQAHGAYRFDNRYVIDAAAAHDKLVCSVIVDHTTVGRDERLRALAQEGARGVRLFSVPTPSRSWIDDPAYDDLWQAAAACNLVVSITCLPDELGAVARAARRHPDSTVVLDHCGFAPPEALQPLTAEPNVVLKVTTNVLDVHGGDPADLVAGLARRFGAHRMMWGSDYSQTHDRSYGALVDLARRAADGLDEKDQAQFLGGTATRLYFGAR